MKTLSVQQWWLYENTHCFFMVVGIPGYIYPKRKVVFQPSIFRCELLVSGRVCKFFQSLETNLRPKTKHPRDPTDPSSLTFPGLLHGRPQELAGPDFRGVTMISPNFGSVLVRFKSHEISSPEDQRPFGDEISLFQENLGSWRFFATLFSPSWRSLNLWKGHLTIPERSLWITWLVKYYSIWSDWIPWSWWPVNLFFFPPEVCDSFPPGLNRWPYDQGFKQKPLVSRKRPAMELVPEGGYVRGQVDQSPYWWVGFVGGCFSSVVLSLGMLIGTFTHGKSYSFW